MRYSQSYLFLLRSNFKKLKIGRSCVVVPLLQGHICLLMVCTCIRAIAQAVSRRLSTAAARVRSQLKSFGICNGQNESGAGFLLVLRFPLPILILLHSSSIIQGRYDKPNSGRRTKWTQSHPTPRNEKRNTTCCCVSCVCVWSVHQQYKSLRGTTYTLKKVLVRRKHAV
jgi:hypothetical protein